MVDVPTGIVRVAHSKGTLYAVPLQPGRWIVRLGDTPIGEIRPEGDRWRVQGGELTDGFRGAVFKLAERLGATP